MDSRALIAPFLLLALSGVPCAAFDTVINLPNDAIPSSIGSNTQLNVANRGFVRDDFVAGSSDGSSVNIEINVSGGQVGRRMKAYAGSVVNLTGGLINTNFSAMNGSVVNISGDGHMIDGFRAESGSKVTMTGGSIGSHFGARAGSVVEISGGYLGEQPMFGPGSLVTLAGGRSGNSFTSYSGANLTIVGNDFTVDGHPIPALDGDQDLASINVPWNSVLSGTFADGSPFSFHNQNYDRIGDNSLTLQEVPLPVYQQGEKLITGMYTANGSRAGEILRVRYGGAFLQHFTAGAGSRLVVEEGGTIGPYLDAVDADIIVDGGTVRSELTAFHGTIVNILDGVVDGSIAAKAGSRVFVGGGELQHGLRVHGGEVEIAGGQILETLSMETGKATISGGKLNGDIAIYDGSTLEISGGSFGDAFRALSGSTVNLIGSGFSIDGFPIEGLVPGIPMVVAQRNVSLHCTLADGEPFELGLFDYPNLNLINSFTSDANLTIILVAEPSTVYGIGAFLLLCLTAGKQPQRFQAIS